MAVRRVTLPVGEALEEAGIQDCKNLPQIIMMGDVVRVLSDKQDCYYTATRYGCSCLKDNCSHQQQAFGSSVVYKPGVPQWITELEAQFVEIVQCTQKTVQTSKSEERFGGDQEERLKREQDEWKKDWEASFKSAREEFEREREKSRIALEESKIKQEESKIEREARWKREREEHLKAETEFEQSRYESREHLKTEYERQKNEKALESRLKREHRDQIKDQQLKDRLQISNQIMQLNVKRKIIDEARREIPVIEGKTQVIKKPQEDKIIAHFRDD